MIDLVLPEPLMWAMRWLLLLGPVVATVVLFWWRKPGYRKQVGLLFAFLYGVSVIFMTHTLALRLGWWSYGWDALMLGGLPADIIIGGAILFGPVIYLAFPRTAPLLVCLPIIIGLHGTVFSSLKPLVEAGPNWFFGVVFVFATAHIPAIYLARWTDEDIYLPRRVVLLAIMFAGLAFGILPSLIMAAMGGEWALEGRSAIAWIALGGALAVTFTIGLAAVQMLCLQGLGTAIPLDPTKRLVRSGIYAFVCNPMQLSAALSWIVLGLFLGNVWIMSASLMAWVFVEGIVRWHHRHDLAMRFPEGWAEYRQNVPEWLPLWRPWVSHAASLTLDRDAWPDRAVASLLERIGPTGLQISDAAGPVCYRNPADVRSYEGLSALCLGLTHGTFMTALIGHAMLIPTMCISSCATNLQRPPA